MRLTTDDAFVRLQSLLQFAVIQTQSKAFICGLVVVIVVAWVKY
jgi:hypothetical protein